MKRNEEIKSEPILPDLKHASMEYSASTDGDDQLSISEEEEITSEELSLIEDKDTTEAAAALKAVLIDSESDEDNFLIQPSDPDEFEEDKKDEIVI